MPPSEDPWLGFLMFLQGAVHTSWPPEHSRDLCKMLLAWQHKQSLSKLVLTFSTCKMGF